jgi:iron complex transport system permease protein
MELNIRRKWLLLSGLLGFLFIADLLMGSVWIPPTDIFSLLSGRGGTNRVWEDILFHFRMPRALTCVLAGSALSVGGLQMQTLFRNGLAGPDVLGLTSGASLAVSLVFMGQSLGLALQSGPAPWLTAAAAASGSTLVFVVMLAFSHRLKDKTSLLIVGLMIGAATSSVVSVLQFISRAEEQKSFLLWSFGTMGRLSWPELEVLALALLVGCGLAFRSTKSLNAWLLGDLYAQSLGIDLNKSKAVVIASTCLLTGAVTAFCGPIAFVGLAVPHLTRLIIDTNNHRILIPAVVLSGAILMLFCDILAQLPGTAYVLPINAITALIGAPVVVWIIIRAKKVYI